MYMYTKPFDFVYNAERGVAHGRGDRAECDI